MNTHNIEFKLINLQNRELVTDKQLKKLNVFRVVHPCDKHPSGLLMHDKSLSGLTTWKQSIPQVLGLVFIPKDELKEFISNRFKLHSAQLEPLIQANAKDKRVISNWQTIHNSMEGVINLVDNIEHNYHELLKLLKDTKIGKNR